MFFLPKSQPTQINLIDECEPIVLCLVRFSGRHCLSNALSTAPYWP
ncbi:MAG: hypothetical protein ACI9D8_001472 [Reinekea sp.]